MDAFEALDIHNRLQARALTIINDHLRDADQSTVKRFYNGDGVTDVNRVDWIVTTIDGLIQVQASSHGRFVSASIHPSAFSPDFPEGNLKRH